MLTLTLNERLELANLTLGATLTAAAATASCRKDDAGGR